MNLKYFLKNLTRITIYVLLACIFLYISNWSVILSIGLIVGFTWGFINEANTNLIEIKEELRKLTNQKVDIDT